MRTSTVRFVVAIAALAVVVAIGQQGVRGAFVGGTDNAGNSFATAASFADATFDPGWM